MRTLDLVFILFLASFLTLASVLFILVMISSLKDKAAKREKLLRYYPDRNGNYEQSEWLLSQGIHLTPGNYSNPNFLIQPTRSEILPVFKPQMEVKIMRQGKEIPELPEISQPQNSLSDLEISDRLIELKRGGFEKPQALAAVNITTGRKRVKWGAYYDKLPS